MKIKHFVAVDFDYREFRLLGRILDGEGNLSSEVAQLRDMIASAVDIHQPTFRADFIQKSLLEVCAILGDRSTAKDRQHGLDGKLAYHLMDRLTVAYTLVARVEGGPMTPGEANDTVAALAAFIEKGFDDPNTTEDLN
jgi:hypothetical protein